MERGGEPPFTKKALEQVNHCDEKRGVYVHLLEKNSLETIVLYVGQTGQNFKKRLNWELSLQHNPVSEQFTEEMKKHVGKKEVSTIFFDEDDLDGMVDAPEKFKVKKEVLRLLVEQAMVLAYNSDDLLNQQKK